MRIGAVFPQIELAGDPAALRHFAVAAEDLGYDHLLVYDHVLGASHAGRDRPLGGPYDENDPFHDPFVMLAHVAALTERIELVTGVLILPQRQTALVARQAADVDLLSGERLRLGVGVGWSWVEYEALGQDFGTRGARQEEQIGLLRRLWTEPLVEHHGRFDRVDRAALVPRPGRSIPIWLGGFSSAAAERAARLADGFVFSARSDSTPRHWARLLEMVAANGRSVEAFGGERVLPPDASASSSVERAAEWSEVGGTHASVMTMGLGLRGIEAHTEHLALLAGELRLRRPTSA